MSTSMLQRVRQRETGARITRSFNLLQCGTFRTTDEDAFRFEGGMAEEQFTIPYDVQFNTTRSSKRLCLVADEDGYVHIIDTSSRTVAWANTIHNNAIYCARWMKNDESILTASGDKTCSVTDIETQTQLAACGHTGSVKCVSVHRDNPQIFASGSRDGNVCIWDLRRASHIPGSCLFPVGTLRWPHSTSKPATQKRLRSSARKPFHTDPPKSVSAVVFLGDSNLIATGGASDGRVKLFDLRKFNERNVIADCRPQQNAGVCGLDLDEGSTRSRLLITCTNSTRLVYGDCREKGLSSQPIVINHQPYRSSFYVKSCFSPCGRYILGGTPNGFLHIFDSERPEISQSLPDAGTGDINGVAWDRYNPDQFVSCADNGDIRIWKYRRYDADSKIATIVSAEAVTDNERLEAGASQPGMSGLSTSTRQATLDEIWRRDTTPAMTATVDR